MKRTDNHHIRSQVFEVAFYKPEDTFAFQRELSAIIRNDLNAITEKCLQSINTPGQVLSIERLELNLGKIPHDRLLQRLPLKYEDALSKALRRSLNHESASAIVRVQSEQSQAVPVIVHFLEKGYMPWNHQAGKVFDELFIQCLEANAKVLLEAIQVPMRSDKVKMRMISNLSRSSIVVLVRRLEPTEAELIINYHQDWCAIHKHNALFKGSEQEIARRLWLFIFKYLYNERGSYFNTKSFLISTLRQAALQFDVPFSRLVFLLKLSYENMAQLGTGSTFGHLIGDIVEQFDLKEELAEAAHQSRPDKPTAEADFKQHGLSHKKWLANAVEQTNEQSFEALFMDMLHYDPRSLLKAIKLLGTDEEAIYKLIEPLKEQTIHKLIGLIEPAHASKIIGYQQELVKAQNQRQILKSPGRNFPRVIWAMIVVVLIDNRGSRFNQKSFTSSVLRRIANRFNLSYTVLLSQLYEGLNAIKAQAATVTLLRIITELYRETFGTTRKPAGTLTVSLVQVDSGSILESIMSGSISDKLIHWQKLSGGLKQLIWLYFNEAPEQFKKLIAMGLTQSGFASKLAKLVDQQVFLNAIFKGELKLSFSDEVVQNDTFGLLLKAYVKDETPDKEVFRNMQQPKRGDQGLSWPQDERLIIESLKRERLHQKLLNQYPNGINLRAYIIKLIGEHPGAFWTLLSNAQEPALLLQHLRKVLKADFLPQMTRLMAVEPQWSRVVLLLANSSLTTSTTGNQRGEVLAQFVMLVKLQKLSIHSSRFEECLLKLAADHQIEAYQLISHLLKTARQAQFKDLEKRLKDLMWRHVPRDEMGMPLYGFETMAQKKKIAADQKRAWIQLIINALLGETKTDALKQIGFDSYSELLQFMLQHEPRLLQTHLKKHLPRLNVYSGIREVFGYRLVAELIGLLAGQWSTSIKSFLAKLGREGQAARWNEFVIKTYSLVLKKVVFEQFDIHRLIEDFLQKLSQAEVPVIAEVLKRLLTGSGQVQQVNSNWLAPLINETELNYKSLFNKSIGNIKAALVQSNFEASRIVLRDAKPFPEPKRDQPAELFINNAGLVLLNAFYPQLFKQLNINPDNEVNATLMREKGAAILQHVLLDQFSIDEGQLVFNKILMGLEMDHIMTFEGFEGEELKSIIQTVHGMIKAAISHWPAIGQTSVDGFRANWLYREGKLELTDDHWELHVERKPYDLLLDQLPFAISPVNYSWMQKRMTVYWQ